MATYEVDVGGKTYEVDAPDEKTAWKWANYEHKKAATGDAAPVRATGAANQAKPTTEQKMIGSPLARMFRGAILDPVDAGAQLLPRGLQMVTSLGGLADNPVSDFFGEEAKRVDAINSQRNDQFEGARKATGQEGIDAWRLAGNVVSPANKVIGAVAPLSATTTAGRVAQGALSGGLGAALLSPVNMGEGADNFAGQKLAQAGAGVIGGGVAGPVIGKLGDQVGKFMAKRAANTDQGRIAATLQADDAIANALRDINIDIKTVPNDYLKKVRGQVVESLKKGEKLDAAAVLRKMDFDEMGLPYTLGQITRDPSQFAIERNLRAAEQGKDLLSRFDYQNKVLQDTLAGKAQGAASPYQAGRAIMDDLGKIDAAMKGRVDAAYGAARDHVGRAAPMDAATFSREANLAIDEGMLGHYLPGEVRGILNDISSGKIPFNVNTATQIDQVLSAAQRSAGQQSPQATAIGKIRDALNRSPIADNVGEDAKAAFDAARGLARERFATQEGSPALGAVANREAVPDNFISQYFLNGRVDDLRRTAKLMSPESFQQVRAQLGEELQRGAFGQNAAGDKLFASERFAQALRKIGDDKLKVFFQPAEIEQLHRMARVGAYINSTPSAAPVMGNPNMAWAADMIGRLPGVSSTANIIIGAGKAAVREGARQKALSEALAANVPKKALDLPPEEKAKLARLLAAGASGVGVFGAVPLRE